VKVRVIIHPAEEGGFWARVPALPGCVTEAETREELEANLREAIQGVLLGPEPTETEGGQVAELDL
jgi:predicted RNase H-like HicB family nuclease